MKPRSSVATPAASRPKSSVLGCRPRARRTCEPTTTGPRLDIVTGWAMGGKGRALIAVGPRLHKVALTLHPDLEQPLTDTNQKLHI